MSRRRPDLAAQFDAVLRYVADHPGSIGTDVAAGVAVPMRRNVALALLRLARAYGLVRAERRPRNGVAWFAVPGWRERYPVRDRAVEEAAG